MSHDDDDPRIIRPPNNHREQQAPDVPEVSNELLEAMAIETVGHGAGAINKYFSSSMPEARQEAFMQLQMAFFRSQTLQALALCRLCKYAGIEGLGGDDGHEETEKDGH
jgi:hypothetical protein